MLFMYNTFKCHGNFYDYIFNELVKQNNKEIDIHSNTINKPYLLSKATNRRNLHTYTKCISELWIKLFIKYSTKRLERICNGVIVQPKYNDKLKLFVFFKIYQALLNLKYIHLRSLITNIVLLSLEKVS